MSKKHKENKNVKWGDTITKEMDIFKNEAVRLTVTIPEKSHVKTMWKGRLLDCGQWPLRDNRS